MERSFGFARGDFEGGIKTGRKILGLVDGIGEWEVGRWVSVERLQMRSPPSHLIRSAFNKRRMKSFFFFDGNYKFAIGASHGSPPWH